jgi:hypothetical protein
METCESVDTHNLDTGIPSIVGKTRRLHGFLGTSHRGTYYGFVPGRSEHLVSPRPASLPKETSCEGNATKLY